MAKMGRPRKEIDKTTFEKLCGIQATGLEIASFFECSDETLNRWCKETYGKTFVDTYKIYSANGKMSLRRQQFRLAEKSAAMAIFLGKQYLGQRDTFPEEQQDSKALEALIKAVEKI